MADKWDVTWCCHCNPGWVVTIVTTTQYYFNIFGGKLWPFNLWSIRLPPLNKIQPDLHGDRWKIICVCAAYARFCARTTWVRLEYKIYSAIPLKCNQFIYQREEIYSIHGRISFVLNMHRQLVCLLIIYMWCYWFHCIASTPSQREQATHIYWSMT